MAGVCVAAEDVAPRPATLCESIDACIAASQHAAGIDPAPLLDDASFLRRVTLDLAGRVPTPLERDGFLADSALDKRARLVDRLLAGPDFAFHQRNALDSYLMRNPSADEAWQAYLLTAARQNRSWEQLFRELMLPDRVPPAEAGAAAFLRARAHGLDALTNDVAVLFFGVNVSCAKCHDHPLVSDWKQDHYYGLASFFQRTYATQRGLVAEKFDGRVKYTTVSGEEKEAAFLFLSGAAVDEPPLEWSDDSRKSVEQAIAKAQKEPQADVPPLPEFSPRAELVRLALEQGPDGFFARNLVNRTWERLLGRGLVHPVDQLHSENPPSHPAVLNALARDFVEGGYDVQRLIRTIVLTEAYARSSRWSAGERPPPALFAVGSVRPLTPRQLALSLDVATLSPELSAQFSDADRAAAFREELEARSAGIAGSLESPDENFQVSVDEALLFSNGPAIAGEFLADAPQRLVGRLAREPGTDVIEGAFGAVLSRSPTADERAAVAEYLERRSDRLPEAIQQVVWALLTSPEFRFNH